MATPAEWESENKPTFYSRISLWTSLFLSIGVSLWYYTANPPDEGATKDMRLFIAKNANDVTEFLRMTMEEKKAFAAENKHPFYRNYNEASEVTKEAIKGIAHKSLDYKPNQYWFYLVFFGMVSFLGFWFIGQMTEAIIEIVNEEKKIK